MARTVHVVGAPAAPARSYTLRDLTRITGLKVRTLQDWGDAGVLLAESNSLHAGRGVPRKFSLTETIIAMLLAGVARHGGVGIGHLERLAGVLREALGLQPELVLGLQPDPALGLHPDIARGLHVERGAPEIGRALQRAIRGIGQNFLMLSFTADDILIEPLCAEMDEPLAISPAGFFAQAGPVDPPPFAFLFDLSALKRIFSPR